MCVMDSMMCMTRFPKMAHMMRLYRAARRMTVLSDCSARYASWKILGESSITLRRISLYVSPVGAFPFRSWPYTLKAELGSAGLTRSVVLFRTSAPSTFLRYEHVCEAYWWHFMLTRMPSRITLRLLRHSTSVLRFVWARHASLGQRLASR